MFRFNRNVHAVAEHAFLGANPKQAWRSGARHCRAPGSAGQFFA
jgi:hypothetical protein